MTIDSTALKSLAQQIITSRNDAKRQDRLDKQDAMRNWAKAIEAQLTAVEAVAEAIYMLKTAKIDGIDSLFTEGWYHRIGFSNIRHNLIGCCGGGYSGHSLFVNFKTKRYVVCEWYGEGGSDERTLDELITKFWNESDVRSKMQQLAEGLTGFAVEAAVKVASLMK